jgi:hypothetical protein
VHTWFLYLEILSNWDIKLLLRLTSKEFCFFLPAKCATLQTKITFESSLFDLETLESVILFIYSLVYLRSSQLSPSTFFSCVSIGISKRRRGKSGDCWTRHYWRLSQRRPRPRRRRQGCQVEKDKQQDALFISR